jgi:hypothetical protein
VLKIKPSETFARVVTKKEKGLEKILKIPETPREDSLNSK